MNAIATYIKLYDPYFVAGLRIAINNLVSLPLLSTDDNAMPIRDLEHICVLL